MSEPIALVLAGGGARGAYEAGVLLELAPLLEERVEIIVGTSSGAINAAFLAANAHEPFPKAAEALADVWRGLRFRDLMDSVFAPRALLRGARYLLLAGLPFRSGFPLPVSVLDTAPLGPTLRRHIAFGQLAENARDGLVSVAVVATSYETTRTAVFHAGPARPAQKDDTIDYAETELTDAHVRASSAIQGLFPAVNLPANERDHWYGDGGARLNSPLRPALELGAKRVILIGLNSGETPETVVAARPDFLDGAAILMQTALAGQLTRDELLLLQGGPHVLVEPAHRFAIGEAAQEVYNRDYTGLRGFFRDPSVSTLGRFADCGRSLTHGELYSYLFVSGRYLERLIELGRAGAQAWLSSHPDLWQEG